MTEHLTWHDATLTRPDSDITVLCWGVEGFSCGYLDTEYGWIACETGGGASVTHWAVPNGPAA